MKSFGLMLAVGFALFPKATVYAASATTQLPELVIYAYDSLNAKGGWGPAIFPAFEKKCGCRIKIVTAGDGGQLLSRLQLDSERGKPTAQVVIGLDQQLWDRAKPLIEPWGNWRPRGFAQLREEARVGEPGEGFLPFDYGVFAFMADTQALREAKLTPPRSLKDLLKPEWRRRILLEDPRTSTPGLAFLHYTHQTLGEQAWVYWKHLRTQWLTLSQGWDAAYGLFLKKEAPIVWSYTTSQAYHEEHGDRSGRYQAILFNEGQPTQVEGASLVKGALGEPGARKRAQDFLEFLISPEAQDLIPKSNWMLPALSSARLPESFQKLPKPKSLLRSQQKAAEVESELRSWLTAIQ